MTTSNNSRVPLAGAVDFTMMYAGHDAFVRDLRHLARAAEDGTSSEPHVLARWTMFCTQLHIHHQAEDAALWPPLRAKARQPHEVSVLDEMEAEHGQIDPHLEQVDAALAAHDPARFGQCLQALTESLSAHMLHEETQALPLVETYLGPKGWAAFGAAIRKTQGLRAGATFFPWLLDETSEAAQAKVLGLFPPPVRLLYRRVWAPRYHRRPSRAQ
jgi:hemerythrin-like domain-containing protein